MASAYAKPQTSAMLLGAFVFVVSIVSFGECQTTAPPPPSCSSYKSCESCVPNPKCLWCFATNNCSDYPVTWLLPPASVCKLSDARWGVCWLNFEALIITLGVVGGVILLAIAICCCCCCCRRSSSRFDREDELYDRRREEIRQRSEERKTDRRARHDEIRKKYGLLADSDHPYSKFENE